MCWFLVSYRAPVGAWTKMANLSLIKNVNKMKIYSSKFLIDKVLYFVFCSFRVRGLYWTKWIEFSVYLNMWGGNSKIHCQIPTQFWIKNSSWSSSDRWHWSEELIKTLHLCNINRKRKSIFLFKCQKQISNRSSMRQSQDEGQSHKIYSIFFYFFSVWK